MQDQEPLSSLRPVALLGFSLETIASLTRVKRPFVAVVPQIYEPLMQIHGIPYLCWDFYGRPVTDSVWLASSLSARGVGWSIALFEETVEWAGAVNSHLTHNIRLYQQYLLYRNKPTMKRRAQIRGLKVGVFEEVADREAAKVFFSKVNEVAEPAGNFPIHLKPVAGVGAQGHVFIESAKEIDQLEQHHFPCLAESHLDGQEFSCEVFVHSGEILFLNMTEYVERGRIRFLPASSKLEDNRDDIRQTVVEAIKAFEVTHGVVHLELFINEQKKISFGEIALRVPGGHIFELIAQAYGFDPFAAFALCSDIGVSLEQAKSVFVHEQEDRPYCGCVTFDYQSHQSIELPGSLFTSNAYTGHQVLLDRAPSVLQSIPVQGAIFFRSPSAEELTKDMAKLSGKDLTSAKTRRSISEAGIKRLDDLLAKALEQLGNASALEKPMFQEEIFQLASVMLNQASGVKALFKRAPHFHVAGLFAGGDWQDPTTLRTGIVKESFVRGGTIGVVESLNLLRFASLAKGDAKDDRISAKQAQRFLERVIVANIEFFPEGKAKPHTPEHLFDFLVKQMSMTSCSQLFQNHLAECVDRHPMVIRPIKHATKVAEKMLGNNKTSAKRTAEAKKNIASIKTRLTAVTKPSKDKHTEPEVTRSVEWYRTLLTDVLANKKNLEGLAGSHQFFQRCHLYPRAVHDFLSDLLQGELTIHPAVEARLAHISRAKLAEGIASGVMAALGNPLGFAKGGYSTTISARVLSSWSQCNIEMLIKSLRQVLKEDRLTMPYFGTILTSQASPTTDSRDMRYDYSADPVSCVLGPALEDLHHQMVGASESLGLDPYQYVNPAMQTLGMSNTYCTMLPCFHVTPPIGQDHALRTFFAVFDPVYNPLILTLEQPIPVGLCVTNNMGEFIGMRGVLFQRVGQDDQGHARAYFYNPVIEGPRHWGNGVYSSISGHGEKEGETSMALDEFAGFVYAFHYPDAQCNTPLLIEQERIDRVKDIASKTWNRHLAVGVY